MNAPLVKLNTDRGCSLRGLGSRALGILVLFILLLPLHAQAQGAPKGLSKDDVVRLLKGDVTPGRVAQMARERGIDFQVTPQIEKELRGAGADNDLIAMLLEIGPNTATPKPTAAASTANPKAIGLASAPITMEVFGDFQCSACRAFFETSVKPVIDDYVVPGKVYLIYRDFPLDMHPYARQAAQIANAAANLGQFQAIERALYDKQDEWIAKGNIDDVIALSFPPGQLRKFHDYETHHLNDINASIERDRAIGMQRHVNQTPSVFITVHGKTEALPGGNLDYKLLKKYFEYLLGQ